MESNTSTKFAKETNKSNFSKIWKKIKTFFHNDILKPVIQQVIETDDKQLIQIEKINETPFTAIKEQGKWYVCLGKYRMTEELPNFDECQYITKNADWYFFLSVMKAMIIEHDNEKKQFNSPLNKENRKQEKEKQSVKMAPARPEGAK